MTDLSKKWWYGFRDQIYLIGGSNALFRFLKKMGKNPRLNLIRTWYPNDIDIFTEINADKLDDNEVLFQLELWQKMLGPKAVLVKVSYNDWYPWLKFGKGGFIPARNILDLNKRMEDFDLAVAAVGTYDVPTAPTKKVQVILLDRRVYNAPSLYSLLNRVADIKIFYRYNYTVPFGKRWYVNAIYAKDILAGVIYNLCPTRRKKYHERGFHTPSD